MEYRYSSLVDSSDYQLDGLKGLCDSISLRQHHYPIKEDTGSIRAQEDWSRLVQPLEHYRGGLATKYNFMSISIPECLPERLCIISYANEFAFLHDGTTCLLCSNKSSMNMSADTS